MSERDVVIVGGGHNGLACAAYLARAGMDTLVLERHAVEGGASITQEAWPGYQVSSAAYVMSLMPQKIVDELELEKFGYKVTVLDPDYFVPYTDSTSLALWSDPNKAAESIRQFSKADAESYIEFDRYFHRVADLMRDLLFVIPLVRCSGRRPSRVWGVLLSFQLAFFGTFFCVRILVGVRKSRKKKLKNRREG